MPQFTPKRQEQIQTQGIAKMVTRTALSDVGDSSAWKHMIAASARQDDEQYYQATLFLQLFSIDSATGDDLDERARDIQPTVISRIQAGKAVGTVVFSRAGTTGTVNIPVGTKVKTADNVLFTTTAVGQITPTSPQQIGGHGVGRDSAPVAILADLAGADGNVAAGTIVKFETKPAGVDEVINLAPTTQGLDKELDDAFRERLKAFIRALAGCTVEALEVGVVGQQLATGQTIRFSKAVEDIVNRGDVILYIDDGTGAAESSTPIVGENVTEGLSGPPADSAVGGETTLYLEEKPVKESASFTLTSSVAGVLVINTDFFLNPASGQINFVVPLVTSETITADYTHYTGLIQLAQKVIDGDSADRENFPGLRAGGILVRVRTPQVLIQNIIVALVLREGYLFSAIETNVETAILNYINELSISGDVTYNELIRLIKGVAGVSDLILSTPSANVVILDDQLARTTTVNITIT